ncbi:MAG: saccharopine dehydrogenase NADP-binding domain-containing protein [Rhodothalassiaceae bacterium]
MTAFLIYGATGYTGRLVAERAHSLGMTPILAGRDAERTRAVAEPLGFEWTAFPLSDEAALRRTLERVAIVLHIAGPFSATSKPMADACIATGTHYLDITGEIDIFEALAARDEEAQRQGVLLLPGCGFDVVPSDCLAAHMKRRMPDATSLDLVITGLGKTSRGTAKTAIESLSHGRRARRQGVIVDLDEPEERRFAFPGGVMKDGISVSWGDVSTAWHATGIPNITVFFEATPQLRQIARMNPLLRFLLATAPGQAFLKRKVDKRPAGPSEEDRKKGYAEILAIARNEKGESHSSLLRTPEGYTLTAQTSLEIVRRLGTQEVAAGFKTPSMLFGPDFILEFDGCMRNDID